MVLLKKKTTIAKDANIHQEIINAAGTIYNYLLKKGEVPLSKIKKDLVLPDLYIEMGLGWLSREDKLVYSKKIRAISVKLNK